MSAGFLTIASLGFKLIGAVASFASAKADAKAQEDFNNRVLANQAIARQNAIIADGNAARARNFALAKTREEGSLLAFQVERQEAQLRATARVSAGESGVAGLSVDALIDDISFDAGLAQTTIESNLEAARFNTYLGRLSDHAQLASIFNVSSAPVNPARQPGAISLISGIAAPIIDFGGTSTGQGFFSNLGFNTSPA